MKYIFPILFLGFLFANCGNDIPTDLIDPAKQLADDIEDIEAYLTANNLNAQSTASGLHYIVEEEGRGEPIEATSTINVILTGYFLDGNTFDATSDCSPITLFLPDLIPGFSEGVQQFNVWGKGKLFLPSALAFGTNGNGSIPANSVIAFDIEIVEQREFDNTKIKDYIAANNLVKVDSTLSGIYYTITELGTGDHPVATSSVSVTYKGYYTDGNSFDQSEVPITFGLSNVIAGWTEAVQLLKKGGAGTFLIPSNLAYGPSGNASIPSNTMLIFDISLEDFN